MPLGEQFRRFFPGLVPIESKIWRVWLVEHEGDFESFEYNVHVGEGVNVQPRSLEGDPELQARLTEQFRQATQKKIDVVGREGPSTWLIEVEERPGTRALGQLVTYRQLFAKGNPLPGPLMLGLVAIRLGADMLEVFEGAGVRIWTVPQALVDDAPVRVPPSS